MSSRAVRYELNRKGYLTLYLSQSGHSRVGPTVINRIAGGICLNEIERDARDSTNLVEVDAPKFPVLDSEAEVTHWLGGTTARFT
jgi:hypothetical protein